MMSAAHPTLEELLEDNARIRTDLGGELNFDYPLREALEDISRRLVEIERQIEALRHAHEEENP